MILNIALKEMDYCQKEKGIEKVVADRPGAVLLKPYVNGGPYEEKQETIQDYDKRLRTFANWPHEDIISHKKLAKAGFFYDGNGDEVQCYSCGVKAKGWKPSDIAVRKHQELSQNCNYIASIFNKASKRNDSALANNNVLNSVSKQLPVYSSSHNNHRNGLISPSVSSLSSTVAPLASSLPETAKTISPLTMATAVGSLQNYNQSTLNATEDNTHFEKMKSEAERLKTFNYGWPVLSPKPCDLAREGFFYKLEGDRVQCAFCRGIVSHWETTDDPLREHARHFAFCPFVMGRDVGNIPLNKQKRSHDCGMDVCGSSHWQDSGSENGTTPFGDRKLDKLENFGVKLHHGPRHPSQASKDARFRSFVGWPVSSPILPKALIDAGFFYIGIQDYTRCFYCDGGLCNWEAGDDPWEEHARWFPQCAYVRLNKGDAWVEACTNKSSSVQKSVSQPPISQQSQNPSSPGISSRVDDMMNSNIVSSVKEMGIFPVDLIRTALLKRIQKVGSSFSNSEELCDSILKLQEETKQNNSAVSSVTENRTEEMEVQVGERNTPVTESLTLPSALSLPSSTPVTVNTVPKVVPPAEDTIKEQNLCKICMDKEIGVLFLPCGHLMSCVECGPAMTTCPFCRQTIRGTVRAFLT